MPENSSLTILFCLISYLIGSIPFGRIIGQTTAGIDITQRGSGNIGATNVAREIGLKWGALTLLLDLIKGALPVYAFRLLYEGSDAIALSLVCFAALGGHQFSIFRRFKGGKGVATALGIYIVIAPLPCALALLIFILTVTCFDFVSLASMIASLFMPLLLWLFGKPSSMITAALVMAALICLKHHENIQRLLQGKERRWSKRGAR